ncbi:hypothetical protein LZC95_02695 [Pendulispora brunnea]|uniref:Uncharacterized protein n=1 Tax=Pendulispora brunnea TaxID=2905690 RepID=A0ABZ2KAQ0_9BACT
MMRRELERALRRKPVPMDAHHRDTLGQNLLAEFERNAPPLPAPRRVRWPRYALAALAVASLLITSQAPAELELEVGKRITVEPTEVANGEELEKYALALTEAFQSPSPAGVRQRIHAQGSGTVRLTVDIWGNPLGTDAEIEERVHGLTGLGSARVQVVPLRGRIHDTLFGKIRHLLHPGASQAEVELARQKIIEELRREDADGLFDAEVSVDADTRRVRVKKVKRGP